MTINEIKNYVDNYIVQNGNVYLKDDNQQILDEETILKVKSARLIYNQAREKYQSDAQQFGKPNGDFSRYITKMMGQLFVAVFCLAKAESTKVRYCEFSSLAGCQVL